MRMMDFCNPKSSLCKYGILVLAVSLVGIVAACTVNPATGEKQFTALLPESQEASLGASEHEKVRATYGEFITGPLADYVNRVGQRVAANTERPDVPFKFFVIDSPIVNAFAIPGGYTYYSRGLLALANDEAELASVMAHEIGHITARHAASRVSQGALAGLGAAILGAATGSQAIGQAASVGSDLYIRSYSRSQESQSDELGIRYLSRAGYDPGAMASFLTNLDAQTKLDARIAGRQGSEGPSYMSTHPVTTDRIAAARQIATNYPAGQQGSSNRATYLSMVNGITYGDSEAQGFVRGDNFYHPKMGFTFGVPSGFNIQNNPSEIIATNASGSVIILDTGRDEAGRDPLSYLTQNWMKANPPTGAESITINGMRAATAGFAGTANNKPVSIRVVAIEWKPGQFFRFQMAIPQNAGSSDVESLKRTTYSFRAMTESERSSIRPYKVRTFVAKAGDTVASVSQSMPFSSYKEERFRVLNALTSSSLTPGQTYKTITQ